MRYIANSEMKHKSSRASEKKKKQPTRMANSESVALPTELEVHIEDFTVFMAPRTGLEPVTRAYHRRWYRASRGDGASD